MWQEILTTDTIGIADFSKVQKTCSDYYTTAFSTNVVTNKFANGAYFNLRAFTYRDADYEINLAVSYNIVMRVVDKDTMILHSVGLGKYKTIGGAVKILMPKIVSLFKEYGVKKIIASWATDVYPKTQDFYQLLAKSFTSFTKVNLTNTPDGVYNIEIQ